MAKFSRLYFLPIAGVIISLILFFSVGQQGGLLFGQGNVSNIEDPPGIENPTNTTNPSTDIIDSGSETNASSTLSLAAMALGASPLSVYDSSLEIQKVYEGLDGPTQMTFLGPNDMLVLQKDDGKVLRIKDCNLEPEVVLQLDVATLHERGLLGIALSENPQKMTSAFIYYTHHREANSSVVNANGTENRLELYDFIDGKLVNPRLIFKVDANKGASHNGGAMTVGPDNNVYLVIGDVAGHKTLTQNNFNDTQLDGTSAILRFTREGQSAGPILGIAEPIDKFYAYGMRNGYGLDFDLLTGKLWDTENGPSNNDEINLVEPGFNSGWAKVTGFQDANSGFDPEEDLVKCLYCSSTAPSSLDFGLILNKYVYRMKDGQYSDPEFVWKYPVGLTAIKFLNSDKLGKNYENDIFVADIVYGAIYHFELNENRDGLVLEGALADQVADSFEELPPITFAKGFGGITDLEVGPDGYLYVLSYSGYIASPHEEAVYRIVPKGTPPLC